MKNGVDVKRITDVLDTVNAVLNNGGIVELHVENNFTKDGGRESKVVAVEIQRKVKVRG